MASVNRVEEKKRRLRAAAGKRGAKSAKNAGVSRKRDGRSLGEVCKVATIV